MKKVIVAIVFVIAFVNSAICEVWDNSVLLPHEAPVIESSYEYYICAMNGDSGYCGGR